MCATVHNYSRLADLVKVGRPLLMLDRVKIELERRTATGVKVVSVNEPYFPGHFTGSPIMPGVLQLASMVQSAEALLRSQGSLAETQDVRVKAVKRFKFRNPALPGDLLLVDVAWQDETDGVFSFTGAVTCEGKTVSQGEFKLVGVEGTPSRDTSDDFAPELPIDEREALGEGFENCAEMMHNIPHRYPFLLVDRQLSFDRENSCNVVVKSVSGGEVFFAALRRPVLPEYLQAEIAAQAACALAFEMPESKGKLAYYMSIDNAEFFDEVVVGDRIVIRVHGLVRGKLGTCTSTMSVGARKVAELSLKFILIDKA